MRIGKEGERIVLVPTVSPVPSRDQPATNPPTTSPEPVKEPAVPEGA